jgi:hypothetical protein
VGVAADPYQAPEPGHLPPVVAHEYLGAKLDAITVT